MANTIYIGGSSGGSSTLTIQSVLTINGSVPSWNSYQPCDATTGLLTVALPTSATATNKGQSITITKTDSSNNPIAIDAYGSETINGSTNYIYLYNQGDSVTLCNQGNSDSKILNYYSSSTGSTNSFVKLYKSTAQTTASGGLTFANSGSINTASNIVFDTSDTTLGSGITYANTGVITLKANSTFKLQGCTGAFTGTTATGWAITKWAKSLDGGVTWSYIGSPSYISGLGNNTAWESGAGDEIARAVITTTQTTMVKLILVKGYCVNSFGADGGTITPVSLPWCEIEEINRASAVIQSADYAYGNITSTPVTTSGVIATLSPINGNLNVSNNLINLNAGKTYQINVSCRVTSANNVAINPCIYNLTNSTVIASGSLVSPNWSVNYDMPNGSMLCTITPTVNTQLQIKADNVGGSTPAITGTYIVTQIGSSATTSISPSLIEGQWQGFTPTITAVTTNPVFGTSTVYKCFYKQIDKKSIKLNFNLIGNNTNGSTGTGIFKIQLPSNINIDTSLLQLATATNWYDATTLCTTYMTNGGGGNNYLCKILPWSATELVAYTSSGYWSSTVHACAASFSFMCEIPIVG